jgi:GPH family glycoside/pentoside/hexuronide:cation symporter
LPSATGFDVALQGHRLERTIVLMRLFIDLVPLVASGVAIWLIATFSITGERAREVRLALEARHGKV